MASTIPTKMKAWHFSSTSGGMEANMKINPQATPPPAKLAPDRVFVEVISTSLNPVDYKLAELPLVGRLAISKPASPGSDYCGKVLSTGSSVEVQPGQLVFGRLDSPTQFGSLAECMVVKRAAAVPLPDGIDPDHAAAVGTAGLTAYQSIIPFAKAGDQVFINGGSGGTGTFGIQFAKAIGCHVTTTCSSPNIQFCKDLGADEVIDYRSTEVIKELEAKGQVFSLFVDNVGTSDALYTRSHIFLKMGGNCVQVGGEVSFRGFYTILTRTLWPGFLGGGKRPYQFLDLKTDYDDFVRIAQWMKEGKVRAVIDSTFAFEEGNKAYEKLKTGRAKGKIVVHVTEKP